MLAVLTRIVDTINDFFKNSKRHGLVGNIMKALNPGKPQRTIIICATMYAKSCAIDSVRLTPIYEITVGSGCLCAEKEGIRVGMRVLRTIYMSVYVLIVMWNEVFFLEL